MQVTDTTTTTVDFYDVRSLVIDMTGVRYGAVIATRVAITQVGTDTVTVTDVHGASFEVFPSQLRRS